MDAKSKGMHKRVSEPNVNIGNAAELLDPGISFEEAQGYLLDVRDIAQHMKAALHTRNLFIDTFIVTLAWVGLLIVLVGGTGNMGGWPSFASVDANLFWTPRFEYDGQLYTLQEVATPDMTWSWVEQVVLPQTFERIAMDPSSANQSCSADGSALLYDQSVGYYWLWGIRFRQIKVNNEICTCSPTLDGLLGNLDCGPQSDVCQGLGAQQTHPFPASGLDHAILDTNFEPTYQYQWRYLATDSAAADVATDPFERSSGCVHCQLCLGQPANSQWPHDCSLLIPVFCLNYYDCGMHVNCKYVEKVCC